MGWHLREREDLDLHPGMDASTCLLRGALTFAFMTSKTRKAQENFSIAAGIAHRDTFRDTAEGTTMKRRKQGDTVAHTNPDIDEWLVADVNKHLGAYADWSNGQPKATVGMSGEEQVIHLQWDYENANASTETALLLRVRKGPPGDDMLDIATKNVGVIDVHLRVLGEHANTATHESKNEGNETHHTFYKVNLADDDTWADINKLLGALKTAAVLGPDRVAQAQYTQNKREATRKDEDILNLRHQAQENLLRELDKTLRAVNGGRSDGDHVGRAGNMAVANKLAKRAMESSKMTSVAYNATTVADYPRSLEGSAWNLRRCLDDLKNHHQKLSKSRRLSEKKFERISDEVFSRFSAIQAELAGTPRNTRFSVAYLSAEWVSAAKELLDGMESEKIRRVVASQVHYDDIRNFTSMGEVDSLANKFLSTCKNENQKIAQHMDKIENQAKSCAEITQTLLDSGAGSEYDTEKLIGIIENVRDNTEIVCDLIDDLAKNTGDDNVFCNLDHYGISRLAGRPRNDTFHQFWTIKGFGRD